MENGRNYTIEIAGVWNTNKSNTADALYDLKKTASPKYRSPFILNEKRLGEWMDAIKLNKSYRSDHTYRVTIRGTGEKGTFRLSDWGDYGNNTGGVTVKIYNG